MPPDRNVSTPTNTGEWSGLGECWSKAPISASSGRTGTGGVWQFRAKTGALNWAGATGCGGESGVEIRLSSATFRPMKADSVLGVKRSSSYSSDRTVEDLPPAARRGVQKLSANSLYRNAIIKPPRLRMQALQGTGHYSENISFAVHSASMDRSIPCLRYGLEGLFPLTEGACLPARSCSYSSSNRRRTAAASSGRSLSCSVALRVKQ
jgi:hypothetical protein